MMIEQRYNFFLALTDDPAAAAVLVLAEVAAGVKRTNSMTVAEAAAELSVHPDTVRDLIKSGKLKHSRVGRAIRIAPDDLDAYRSGQGAKPRKFRCLKIA